MNMEQKSSNKCNLLIQHQPKRIKTEQEYQNALAIVESMMSRKMNEAETEFFDLLVLLVENYETIHYPIAQPTPQATLESLIHEFEIKPDRLVAAIASGKHKITSSQAEAIAQFFNDISPNLSLTAQDFWITG